MRKHALVVVVLCLVLGLTAGPSQADGIPHDVGVMQATVTVTPGWGLPFVHTWTAGTWKIDAQLLSALHLGAASMVVYGDYGPFLGIGADCWWSEGSNGSGSISYFDGTTSLSNVAWEVSMGGWLVITGNASGHTQSILQAVLRLTGGVNCATGDATQFDGVGVYSIL